MVCAEKLGHYKQRGFNKNEELIEKLEDGRRSRGDQHVGHRLILFNYNYEIFRIDPGTTLVGYILYKQKTSYLYIIWVFDLLKTKNKMSGFL